MVTRKRKMDEVIRLEYQRALAREEIPWCHPPDMKSTCADSGEERDEDLAVLTCNHWQNRGANSQDDPAAL